MLYYFLEWSGTQAIQTTSQMTTKKSFHKTILKRDSNIEDQSLLIQRLSQQVIQRYYLEGPTEILAIDLLEEEAIVFFSQHPFLSAEQIQTERNYLLPFAEDTITKSTWCWS